MKALDAACDDSYQKLVLCIVEAHSECSRIGVFPLDIAEVAKTACCSQKTVRRALGDLIKKGLVTRTQAPNKPVPYYGLAI